MEDMIIDEFSSKNEDIQSGPKRLDIFQHLKLSLRNSEFNCKCPGAYPVYYCIPCKVSICEHCGLEDHKKHILISLMRAEKNGDKYMELIKIYNVEFVLPSAPN